MPQITTAFNKYLYLKKIENKKKIIASIINIFETGLPDGDYSLATVLKDGAGISYGRSQSTDGSNSLDKIVMSYIDSNGLYKDEFIKFIPYLTNDFSTNEDPKHLSKDCLDLIALLKKAGTDPIMQKVQDTIFDSNYFQPAIDYAHKIQLSYPLSIAVLYDTCIHSGPNRIDTIRMKFPESPPIKGGDEKAWTKAYVKARRTWLLANPNPVVQKTIYRMDTFEDLINKDNWNLNPIIKALGVQIT